MNLNRLIRETSLVETAVLVISAPLSCTKEPPQIGSVVSRNPERARRNRLAEPNVVPTKNKSVRIPGSERNAICSGCGRKRKWCSCNVPKTEGSMS